MFGSKKRLTFNHSMVGGRGETEELFCPFPLEITKFYAYASNEQKIENRANIYSTITGKDLHKIGIKPHQSIN